jgi:hypothetical protein
MEAVLRRNCRFLFDVRVKKQTLQKIFPSILLVAPGMTASSAPSAFGKKS